MPDNLLTSCMKFSLPETISAVNLRKLCAQVLDETAMILRASAVIAEGQSHFHLHNQR